MTEKIGFEIKLKNTYDEAVDVVTEALKNEGFGVCFCQSNSRPVARENRAHLGLKRIVSRVENAPI